MTPGLTAGASGGLTAGASGGLTAGAGGLTAGEPGEPDCRGARGRPAASRPAPVRGGL